MKVPRREIDSNLTTKQRHSEANKITLIGTVINLCLSGVKLFAGIIAGSHAMIADSVHSLSDLGTDIAVFIGLFLSSRPKDSDHNYGHGKYESLSTLVIAVTLLSVGIGIGFSSVKSIIVAIHGERVLTPPGIFAFIAAILSVITKEWLFRYTKAAGKRLNSPSMIANAFHHRSDAYSSIGTGIGIGCAILLGAKWAILDQIAAIIVSILILKDALGIGYKSINELLEVSLPEEDKKAILRIAAETRGVINPHNLKTRRIGSTIAVDLHIRVDSSLSVEQGHTIAHTIENSLINTYGKDLICSIHVEP